MAYSERRISSNDIAETACIGASFKKSQPGVPVACRLLEHPLSVCSQLSSSNIDKLECLSVRDASVGTENAKETLFHQGQTSPAVLVQRPRAILSSPDNDQILSELQGQPKLLSYVNRQLPKAPPTPLEESYCVNGIPSQLPESLFSTEGKYETLKGMGTVIMPSVKSVGDQREQISANQYQDETKRKSFVWNGIEPEQNSVKQKLDVDDGKIRLKGNKDQLVRKQVSSALDTHTKIKKEMHTPSDGKGKPGRIPGFQGTRPWY
eukprot:c24850_g1_i1 orf=304-1095(+)